MDGKTSQGQQQQPAEHPQQSDIGERGSLVACFINRDWKTTFNATILTLWRAPGSGGGHAFAGFLVDRWCIGLKHAWGELDTDREQFDGMIRLCDAQLGMVPCDLALARRLVLGGVRWAEENGFVRPPRSDRWLDLLAPGADPREADLSDFGHESGKLVYTGNRPDLRNRLADGDLERFIARDDVECAFEIIGGDPERGLLDGDYDEELDEETIAVLREATDAIVTRGTSALRKWCFANQQAPAPHLDLAFSAVFAAQSAAPGGDDAAQREAMQEALATVAEAEGLDPDDLQPAMEQCRAFMRERSGESKLPEAPVFDEEDEDGHEGTGR